MLTITCDKCGSSEGHLYEFVTLWFHAKGEVSQETHVCSLCHEELNDAIANTVAQFAGADEVCQWGKKKIRYDQS